jgi:hypothetical protein
LDEFAFEVSTPPNVVVDVVVGIITFVTLFLVFKGKKIYISLKLGDKKRRCINLYKYIVGKIYRKGIKG